MGSLAAHSIITNGLTCGKNTACENGAIITTFFSLYCTDERPPGGGGGGIPARYHARVLQPGEIHMLYQPVPREQQYYVIPRDQEARYFKHLKHVVLRITMGKLKVEKEYAVGEKRAGTIVQVINLMNKTMENMSVVAKGIRRVSHRAIVRVTKFRKTK